MRSVWGRTARFPRALHQGAWAQAKRLGRPVMTDDLHLLAIAELDDGSAARRALEAEEITAERLAGAMYVGDGSSGYEPDGYTYAPPYSAELGRAEMLAAVFGDGAVTPEHVLIAVLWDPVSHSSQLLWRLGVRRERVLERLAELGVPVPSAPVPPQIEVEWGERVWFERDQVRAVIDFLQRRLGTRTRWGFNYEGDRAWVHAEARVDLEALVREALAG